MPRKTISMPLATRFPETRVGDPASFVALDSFIEELGAQKPEYENYCIHSITGTGETLKAVLAPCETWEQAVYPGTITEQWEMKWDEKFIRKDIFQEHPGMELTGMDPYTRSISYAPLTPQALHARNTIAAQLKYKPQDVETIPLVDGGWCFRLKNQDGTKPYIPSKHDPIMDITSQLPQVGGKGWWWKTVMNTSTLIFIHPGILPTFPKTIPMKTDAWQHPSLEHILYGVKLPVKGRKYGEDAYINLKTTPGILVCGASNGGKTTLINSIIFGVLAAGGNLAIIDDKGSAPDYQGWRPWLENDMWGGDSPENAAACLKQFTAPGGMYETRMQRIGEAGKANWWEMDDQWRRENPLWLVVADEVAQYAAPVKKLSGDKDNPDVLESAYRQNLHNSAYSSLLRLAQVARKAGICFLYAAQSATSQNGLDPSVRNNLSAKICVGANADPATTFTNKYPLVPANVKEEGVAVGTGVAEIAGQNDYVYKAYFETGEDGQDWGQLLAERLTMIRPPAGDENSGKMLESRILQLVPAAGDKPGGFLDDESIPGDEKMGMGGFGADPAPTDPELRGAAKAAHMLAQTSAPVMGSALAEAMRQGAVIAQREATGQKQ